MAPRRLLTHEEVSILARLYLTAAAAVNALRASHPLGAFIHQVKVPNALSESIAGLFLQEMLESTASIRPGGRRSDLVIGRESHYDELIAVKGTGATAG